LSRLVEETGSAFIVRTANRLVVFDNEPRRVARNIARLPDLLSPRE